jgi:hypothetical protein
MFYDGFYLVSKHSVSIEASELANNLQVNPPNLIPTPSLSPLLSLRLFTGLTGSELGHIHHIIVYSLFRIRCPLIWRFLFILLHVRLSPHCISATSRAFSIGGLMDFIIIIRVLHESGTHLAVQAHPLYSKTTSGKPFRTARTSCQYDMRQPTVPRNHVLWHPLIAP